MADLIHWQDMEPGRTRVLGSVTPTRDEILAFARQFDPQPFHLDEEAARNSVFGALCASGWHTCAMAIRLMVDNFLSQAASLGSPGMEGIQWLKPVFPGDTLTLHYSVLDKRPLASRPGVGLLRTRTEMTNQRGEPVLRMEGYGMMRRRHPASPAA